MHEKSQANAGLLGLGKRWRRRLGRSVKDEEIGQRTVSRHSVNPVTRMFGRNEQNRKTSALIFFMFYREKLFMRARRPAKIRRTVVVQDYVHMLLQQRDRGDEPGHPPTFPG